MTGNPSAEGEAQVEAIGDGSAQEGSLRTPDQATVGMPSAPEAEPGPSSTDDAASLQVGELLAGRFPVNRFIAVGRGGKVDGEIPPGRGKRLLLIAASFGS